MFFCLVNLIEYRRLDAIATRTLMEAKSINWKQYLSTVNKDTNIKTVWRVINSLSGKQNLFLKIILVLNNDEIAYPGEIAFNFGSFFSSVSSDNNYSENFLLHKIEEELNPIAFPHSANEKYNTLFSLDDLSTALESCKDSSPGEDGIHYTMLKHLPVIQLNNLLKCYNSL